MIDLTGKTALITGANGGLAPGLARSLAKAGAVVVLGVRQSRARADLLAAEIGAVVVSGDVSDPHGVESVIAAASAAGPLDIVVNNAALQPTSSYLDTDVSTWDVVAGANLRSTHLMTRAAAQHMIESSIAGSIINIGSIEGSQPAPFHVHYATAKAGLIMLTRGAALELGEHQIRVNSVSPGLIDDGEVGDRWPEGVDRWNAAAPLKRLVSPTDVGNAVAFLASDLAAAITGHDLVVDAGVLTHPTW
ncbi:MAG: SDR family NAD(P)-dependent oxidoreductase [Acidimicrobiales bacterium]|jgi:NAD(P)-dependent dehydrogenase (short-subunit alcohol dehydrogenase family)